MAHPRPVWITQNELITGLDLLYLANCFPYSSTLLLPFSRCYQLVLLGVKYVIKQFFLVNIGSVKHFEDKLGTVCWCSALSLFFLLLLLGPDPLLPPRLGSVVTASQPAGLLSNPHRHTLTLPSIVLVLFPCILFISFPCSPRPRFVSSSSPPPLFSFRHTFLSSLGQRW